MLLCILEAVEGEFRLLGARVMRFVLELRALRAVSAGSCAGSCAPCAGVRQGHATCTVGVVM